MGIWEQFPFTNFHEQNLDWAYNSIKELDGRVDTLEKSGNVSKEYVDEQDAALDEKISGERSARTTADKQLQNQITAHTTSISGLNGRMLETEKNIGVKPSVPNFGSIWSTIGEYNATQAIGSKLLQVQTVGKENQRSIAGTDGAYDLTKGTIQARLNTIEAALKPGSLVKLNGEYQVAIAPGTARGKEFTPSKVIAPFDFAICERESSVAHTAGDSNNAFLIVKPPKSTTTDKYNNFVVVADCPGESTTFNMVVRVFTFEVVAGSSGGEEFASISYVDEKTGQLATELGNVEAAVQDAYTKAETADNNAAIAKANATTAASTASSALEKIGTRPAESKYNTLWDTIGIWSENVPMALRINPAYNWSWNNRSAINGTSDYPTDKASINSRLSELETAIAKFQNMPKIARGSVLAYQDQDTIIDYQSAGFTEIPTVVATYANSGAIQDSVTRSQLIFAKTTSSAKIRLSGTTTHEQFAVDWIAVGV
jgi:hypothetical protein